MTTRGFRFLKVFLAIALASPAAWATDVVVGPGNCDESGFADALATVDGSGGGTVSFDCGTVTIPSTYNKGIANAVTIDGGGVVTFDGDLTASFFQVFFSANVTLRGLTLEHGAFDGVHALENFGTLTLDHVLVADSFSAEPAVVNYGNLTVESSTFEDNESTSADGGALANLSGTANVAQSTFDSNDTAGSGAAIYSDGTTSVVNSTFHDNDAESGGGAIYQTANGFASISYVTIYGNTASFGAGIYADGSGPLAMVIDHSIVSANATGNCDGVIGSGGFNVSNDNGCGGAFTDPTDGINQNLPLGPLQDNGGPTQTMMPLPGNTAIDRDPGAACSVATDQRGVARPVNNACDSGAVEVSGANDVIFADGFDG